MVDADALNLMATTSDVGDLRAPAILTPHPGEFARIRAVARHGPRPGGPRAKARVRPGARGPPRRRRGAEGSRDRGERRPAGLRQPHRESGLATGGSGDVLTGLCAGFVAQFHPRLDLFECAAMATWVHGHAADLLVGRRAPPG